jgi:glycosyl transferase family 87
VRRPLALLAPAVALGVVWGVALFHGPTADVHVTDVNIYRGYADLLSAGREPYSGFAFEYPPLALVPMWLAGQLSTADTYGAYDVSFAIVMLVAAYAVLVLTAALARERAVAAAWIVALAPLVTGAVIRTHFDLVAVALVLGALLALTRGRPTLGFAVLGLGAMTKLFPALLVPVAAAWLVAGGRGQAAARGAAAFVAVVAVISLPFLGSGYVDAYRYQLDRPVQIESTPATVLFALGGSTVTGGPSVPDAYKSNGLVGGAADGVQALFTVLLVAALLLVVALVVRGPPDERTLLLGSLAALLAFSALGKVLSPQFLVWLVPFAALAWVRQERALALLLGAAVLLTQLEFPARYTLLVDESTKVILLVAVRNAVLLVALGLSVARLAESARLRRPAWAPTP